MDNQHECYIGMQYDYDNTYLTTLANLKVHIKSAREFAEIAGKWFPPSLLHSFTLDDYCDKRKSTDLTRFNYCPLCGKKIDWKAIKRGE